MITVCVFSRGTAKAKPEASPVSSLSYRYIRSEAVDIAAAEAATADVVDQVEVAILDYEYGWV
jgi:hypothetical protein